MLEFIYYVLLLIAIAIFAKGVKEKIDFVNSGRPSSEPRTNNKLRRLGYVIKDAFLLIRLIRREKKMGIGHFLVLWGFIILFVNIIVFTVYAAIPEAFGGAYVAFKYSMTASAILFFAGLLYMAFNRYVLRPLRFSRKYDNTNDDSLVLLLLIFLAIFGIALKEYFRFVPEFATTWIVDFLWFAHAVLVLAILALIPYTKLMHIIAAPFAIFTKTERKPGVLRPTPQTEDYVGMVKRSDLTRRDLLASLACMRCGRCQDNCPAFNSRTSLSPMFLVQNIRHIDKILKDEMPIAKPYEVVLEEDGGEVEEPVLLDNVLDMHAIWACTTCRACMEMCPVYVEQMDMIIEMRRGVIESGETPPDIRDFLTNIQKQKNPWGEGKFKRDQWVKKSEVPVPTVKDNPEFEWLWFVGCAHSFDNRNIPVTAKLAKILKDIGVNYAILGREEGCCGNDVRRVGEEGLFQLLKEENVAQFEKFGVKKVIATSPHCFNTLKNEYEGYDVKFILEVIYEAIKDGRLKLKKPINKTVTFHDPCYLGRYNGLYELPREILKAIPGIKLVEMPRNRNRSFCCGAGGGNLVREYPGQFRPNNLRAKEAAETGAEILAVACPFCMIMLEDGVKSEKLEQKITVMDVIELVYESAYT
jgi:Fe-S oxidoreductase/nitrate reductase gamma subunit